MHRPAARKLYLYLAALFITSLVVSNLIFQKFFYWRPFDWEVFGITIFELSVGIFVVGGGGTVVAKEVLPDHLQIEASQAIQVGD